MSLCRHHPARSTSHSILLGLILLFMTLLYDLLSELGVLPRYEGTPALGFSILYVAAARALSVRYERDRDELLALRGELESRVQQRTLELEEANHRLDQLSRTDALTGLANRRGFIESAGARLRQGDATLVMIDIDHFKRINDRFGHDAGDTTLRAVSTSLADALRAGELLARWGGEEFIALLDASPDVVARVERMRLAVAAVAIDVGTTRIRISASFGIATTLRDDALEAAIARADDALYRSKREGRDRVSVAPARDRAGQGNADLRLR